MAEKLAYVGIIIIVIALVFGIGYGMYQVERWWNWKWGYSDKVAAEIEPLKTEI